MGASGSLGTPGMGSWDGLCIVRDGLCWGHWVICLNLWDRMGLVLVLQGLW